MDAQKFLAEFEHIANAPGGVGRLRELVLQLAISGRLLERAVPETPVTALLAAAAKLRQEYERELTLRTSRPHSHAESQVFAIPEHWKWVRLDQLSLYIQRGKGPKYAEGGPVYVASQKCVRWDGFDLKDARSIAEGSIAAYGPERFLCDGDLLWNSTGTGTAGRIAIFHPRGSERVVADSHLTVIRLANALPRYVWCVIASPWVQARIHPDDPNSLVSGTTQQVELATSTVRGLYVPCPPIEEQVRIAAKVDELMSLCDRLEQQQRDSRKSQSEARDVALQALVAPKLKDVEAGWARLKSHFESLFSTPEDVHQLRDVIFYLGLLGFLQPTAQRTGSKEGLVALPAGWHWSTLAEITEYITSGSRGWNSYLASTGDIFIRSQDIKRDELVLEHPAHVLLPAKAEGKRTLVRNSDLLLTITGGNVGRCAIVPELAQNAYVSQHVALVRLQDQTLAEFIHFWIVNQYGGRGFLSRYIYGDKPGLNLTQVGSIPVPVPPANELPKILESLSRFQQICDHLLELLGSKRSVAKVLSATAVAAVTGIAIQETEDGPVKPPQIELISQLRLDREPDVKDQAPLATLLARHQGEMSARGLWQRFGGEIDEFYAQLKIEVAQGWIAEPGVADVRERPDDAAAA